MAPKLTCLRWVAAAILALSGGAASAGISYTCDPTVDASAAGTCAFLNSIIASQYGSGATASIYVQMGTTQLATSYTGPYNTLSFSDYVTRLNALALASGSPTQASAVAALNAVDAPIYGGGNVVVTSALGTALGLTGMMGTTASGTACSIGLSGCYNGIITVASPFELFSTSGGTQSLYFDQSGGSQPANAFDYYSLVEHETNQVLGISSCVGSDGSALSDLCAASAGAGAPSALDLFRYASPGILVADSSLSQAPGAYFSVDGGLSNGAAGLSYDASAAPGLDGDYGGYADFAGNCNAVQDSQACLGKALDILGDGGAETGMLQAIGYGQIGPAEAGSVPEPDALSLVGLAMFAAALAVQRRRQARRLG